MPKYTTVHRIHMARQTNVTLNKFESLFALVIMPKRLSLHMQIAGTLANHVNNNEANIQTNDFVVTKGPKLNNSNQDQHANHSPRKVIRQSCGTIQHDRY